MTRNLTTADLALASAPGVDSRRPPGSPTGEPRTASVRLATINSESDANDAAILETIRRSEAQLRSIIENTTDVIGIVDPEGAILYHSVSLERTLDRTRNELAGSSLLDHVHPDDRIAAHDFLTLHGIEPGGATTIRLRLRRRNGTFLSFEVIGRHLAADGSAPSIVLNARDITEREMIERQLEQARRLTGLGRAAATVAHEFNNVLMGMQPFAEILQRSDVTPDMIQSCGRHIANSIQRGKRVAVDILRFTQPAAPVLEPLHLASWWAGLEPELDGRSGRGVSLRTRIDDAIHVLADGGQLAQVFANLVSNARDAMPLGGQLTVAARAVAHGEVFAFAMIPEMPIVHISVADTGSGIDPDILGHVFDPLFTTKETGGTGLGLAVAHQIIARQGGRIFVESETGAGTTFHIFLPSARSEPIGRGIASAGGDEERSS